MNRPDEKDLTDAVLGTLAASADPRFKRIMTSLIRHLHDFVREVELSEAEWRRAIEFLTATGQASTPSRQEYILLSDMLGVSMLVDALNHRKPADATPSTVLGPFYVEGAPELPMGADISRDRHGEAAEVTGTVFSVGSGPIKGALLDVWQAAPNGFYDTQDPVQPRFNYRGRFRTGADGTYRFHTRKPVSYPVPTDGPAGAMLQAMGRHPFRPAHIHVMLSAPGHESLTTHIFVAGDPYLDSDAVFGVKNALVTEFRSKPDGSGVEAVYDFGLNPL
ncbi:MAG TPA: intradiol ring-cleavage dioxygenase [Stellaceae bacterium]|nr:intradiol ring-cleavage dioxygenase [Stellaceae bacterium]